MMDRVSIRSLQIPALLLGGLLILAGCGQRPRKPGLPPPKPSRPTLTVRLTNVHPVQVDERGRKLWEAQAKSLQASEEQKTGDLVQVKAILYQNGVPETTITAPRMKVDYNSRQLILSGGILAENKRQSTKFKVDRLKWNTKTGKFIGQGGVKLEKGQTTITGGTIQGDTRLKQVQISGNAQVVVP